MLEITEIGGGEASYRKLWICTRNCTAPADAEEKRYNPIFTLASYKSVMPLFASCGHVTRAIVVACGCAFWF